MELESDPRVPQSFIDERQAQQEALDHILGDMPSPTVTRAVWEGFRMSLHDALSELARQRDDAIRERDQARAQLQTIGRKAFWAAKAQ
jgi:hypothetical protein